MREQGQTSPRESAQAFSSNCCGSGRASQPYLATLTGGKKPSQRTQNLLVSRQLSPFSSGIFQRKPGEPAEEIYFWPLAGMGGLFPVEQPIEGVPCGSDAERFRARGSRTWFMLWMWPPSSLASDVSSCTVSSMKASSISARRPSIPLVSFADGCHQGTHGTIESRSAWRGLAPREESSRQSWAGVEEATRLTGALSVP
jgi:hypothetical protein